MLLLHRTQAGVDIIAAMEAAVAMGRFDPDLVAVAARRVGQGGAAAAPVALPASAPPAARDQRPAPSLGAYDELLSVGVGA